MRARKIWGIMLLFLCAFGSAGCGDDDNDVERIVIMSVSPKLAWIEVASPSEPGMQVMECIIEESNEKLYIAPNQIEGFEYSSGYEYKLRVRITPLDNPSADGYTERYELIEIISQNKTPFKIQLMYAVDAELKDVVESDLQNSSSVFIGSGYVFDEDLMTWMLVDANNIPILNGTFHRESIPWGTELPASYKLLQPDEQVAAYGKWTFIFYSKSEQFIRSYDALITQMPGGGRYTYYRLWFYEDLTDYYKTKYPDAGVRGVVRVQRLSWNGF